MSFRIDQLAVLNLATVGNSITAGSFVKSGGTSSQFLKADGSVDSSTYITGITSGMITTALGYTPVPNTRTLTINGTSYDLSADRSWTIAAGVSSVTGSGSGISVSPTTGAVVISNTGVTSNVAGTGISVSGATGAVTITNTGVTSIVAGTAITVSGATGAVTINNAGVTSVNGNTGAVTGIITTSNYNSYSPTLTGGGASGTWGINITGSAGSLSNMNISQFTNDSGYITSSALSGYLPLSGGQLSGVLYIGTTASGVYAQHWKDGSGSYIEAIGNSTGTRKIRIQSYDGSTAYAQWFVDGANLQIYGTTGTYTNFLINSSVVYLRYNGSDKFWTGSDGTRNAGWLYMQNTGVGIHYPSYNSHFYMTGANYWHMNPTGGSSYGGLIIYSDYNSTAGGSTYRKGYLYYDTNGFGLLGGGDGDWAINVNPSTGKYVTVGGHSSSQAYSAVTGVRLMFGGGDSDAQGNYYIGTNLENYGGNYNKLDLRWHTGIRMGAQPGYGGIRFFDTEDLGTKIFSIGEGDANVRVTNILYVSGDVRAPIYYDSANTGYYGDFAGTSNINALTTAGVIQGGSYFRNNGITTNVVYYASTSESFGNILSGVGGSTRATFFRADSTAAGASVWWGRKDGSGNSVPCGAIDATDGSFTHWINSGGTTGGWTQILTVNSSGLTVNSGNIYSPIYYDSSNTGYYGDFASTSVMNAINFGTSTNNATLSGNSDWGVRLTTASGYIQFGPANGSWAHIYSGLSFYFNQDLYTNGNLQLHTGNYTSYTLPIGGSWYGSGLPGSRWNGLSVSGGEIVFGNGLPNAGQMGILIDGCYVAGENNGYWSMGSTNTWSSRRGWYWDGTYINFTTNSAIALFSDVRASIFYDSDDTTYYLDPHSTGVSFRGRGEIFLGPNSSGRYTRLGGNGGATDEATLSASNGNLHIDCKAGYGLYLNYYSANTIYLGGAGYTITGNGSYYNGTAANANSAGNADTVDGYHASTSTIGNYIVVRDGNGYIFGNYINMTDDGNPGGGTAITSFITKQGDNYYRSVSPTNAMVSIRGVASGSWGINITGSAGSLSNMNISQFTNNSGYITSASLGAYLPLSGGTMTGAITTPTGTSIYIGGQNVSTSSRLIINWHTDSDYNYLIGKRAGSWTQPMDIAFYTGLRYHAHQSYGGHKFYTSGYDSTLAFSIGEGDSNTRVYGNLYAPIIYDIDNTGYYLNPAGTSRLSTIYCGDVYNDLGGWFRNYGATGIYNQSYGQHFYSDSSAWWNMGGNNSGQGIRFRDTHGGTVRGHLYYDTSYNVGFLDYAGNWTVRVAGGGAIYFYNTIVVGQGLTASNINMYDSDNTTRTIHCNSNRIGFLNSSSSWGSYCDNTGNWISDYGVYASDWFRTYGYTGLYSQTYGSHLRPTANSSYGTWEIYGYSKGGYNGLNVYDPAGYNNNYMHENGNGGLYQENGYGWIFYWYRPNSCLGIGTSTTSGSYRMYVNGGIYATGDVVAYSDKRKKTDIVTIDNALDKVTNMRGVFYTKLGEEEKGRKTGVIAQEVNEILPEAVTYAADVDEYGVAYGNIVGVLIEAIKEQQKQIEELKQMLK